MRLIVALGAALVFTFSLAVAGAAAQSPGDPEMTVNVGDDVAGGETPIDFVLHFSGETANGTPVYIYAPKDAAARTRRITRCSTVRRR
jgi:hypothetical protein